MERLVTAEIDQIDPNPFRLLGEYPYVATKLDALQRSFKDVGMWAGVIARENDGRYQLAFGHHRIEAARRANIETVTLIVDDLTDEQMLQYMGRENMEDYNADFLVMLETWQAATNFCSSADGQMPQPVEIARLLGWTAPKPERNGAPVLNRTARACSASHALISGGYLSRDDLRDLSVKSATEIVERAHSRIEKLEKIGKTTKRPAKEIEDAKRQYGKAAARTAKQYREEEHGLAQSDLRGRVDVNAYGFVKDDQKKSPLFNVFVDAAVQSIDRMLATDATAEKLEEIAKFASEVVDEEDQAALRRLDYVLRELGVRSNNWQKRLIPNKVAKLVPVKEIASE